MINKIDVSKCEYKGGIECRIRDYPILNCADVKIEDCHYKQLQQLKEYCKQVEELCKEKIVDIFDMDKQIKQLEKMNKILYEEKCDLIKENEELKKATITLAEGLNIRQKCLDEIEENV